MIFEDAPILSLKLHSAILIEAINKGIKEMAFDKSSPLGALSRRFESCRPDSNKPII